MPITTVGSSTIIFCDPTDPENQRVKVRAWDRKTNHAKEGSIEKYAAGNKAAYLFPGQTDSFELLLQDLTQDEYDQMQAFIGRTILFRDRHKRKVFGTFFTIGVVDYRDHAYDISINFENVTYDEFVASV